MTKINYLKKIASISKKLDSLGLYSYADVTDSLLEKLAKAPYDIPLYPEDEDTSSSLSSKKEEQNESLSYMRWKKDVSEKNDYTTEQIPFSWGRYGGKYKTQSYYVSSRKPSNYLGKIQIPGDPFTYDLDNERVRVISAPYDKRGLIGKTFSKKDIPEKYLPNQLDLASKETPPKESPSQQAFVSTSVGSDFYLSSEKSDGISDLIKMFPGDKEEINRLMRYSGIKSYLNEMRTEYPAWSKLTKEDIESEDSNLITLDLFNYLNIHAMVEDYFIDELPDAIKFLQDQGNLLD